MYEDVLSGTAFETKLRHVLSQKAIAREFAAWIQQEHIHFRANTTNEPMTGFAVVSSNDKKNSTAYAPLQGFTTVDLGCSEKKDAFNLIQEIEAPFSKHSLLSFHICLLNIWH